jgi:hypothetical protein
LTICRLPFDSTQRINPLEISKLRRDLIGSMFCSVVGVVLCALPHVIWLFRLDQPVWAADQDELYYVGVAGQALFDHPFWLGDPTRDGGHSVYQALPLLPGIWIARLVRLGPELISLVWRCWGGGLAGLAWYWVVRCHRVRPFIAVAVAIFFLTDIGMLEFRPLLRLPWVAWQVASGRPGALFASKPMIFRQFRLATPCLTMPYLLLFIGLHARARSIESGYRQIAAGLGFGLLFYVYFYYWTAAALALTITTAFDTGHRRVSLNSALIGGFVAIPSLVASYRTQASTPVDWLHRSDKFLAIGRFTELSIPLPAVVLLVLTALIVARHRRELALIWSLALAGLVLMNHQVITALQLENFHWLYVAGPSLSLLVGLLVASPLSDCRATVVPGCVVVMSALCLVTGGWLRSIEAVKTKEVVEILEIYRAYREQRVRDPFARALVADSVVAGEELTTDWAAILERSRPLANYWIMLSPSVTNDDWDLRIALNSYLMGESRLAFVSEQKAALSRPGFRGPWGSDQVAFARRLDSRLAWYDKIAAQPEVYLAHTHLRYVWLPRGQAPPGVRSLWTGYQNGPFWSIWEYRGLD